MYLITLKHEAAARHASGNKLLSQPPAPFDTRTAFRRHVPPFACRAGCGAWFCLCWTPRCGQGHGGYRERERIPHRRVCVFCGTCRTRCCCCALSRRPSTVADHVRTADNYVLGMFRIPYGRNEKPPTKQRPVVFLQHGLLDSSCVHRPWHHARHPRCPYPHPCAPIGARSCMPFHGVVCVVVAAAALQVHMGEQLPRREPWLFACRRRL